MAFSTLPPVPAVLFGSASLAAAAQDTSASLNRPQLLHRIDSAESSLVGNDPGASGGPSTLDILTDLSRLAEEDVVAGIDVPRVREHAARAVSLLAGAQPADTESRGRIAAHLQEMRRAVIVPWILRPEAAAPSLAAHTLPKIGPYSFSWSGEGRERLEAFFRLPHHPTRLDLVLRVHAAHALQVQLDHFLAEADPKRTPPSASGWMEFCQIWMGYLHPLRESGDAVLTRIAESTARRALELHKGLLAHREEAPDLPESNAPAPEPVHFQWDACSIGTDERRLSEFFRLPERPTAEDVLLRRYAAIGLQAEIAGQLLEIRRVSGGILPAETLAAWDGLEAHMTYMWLSHRGKSEAEPLRMAPGLVEPHVQAGFKLHALLQEFRRRTHLAWIVEAATQQPSIESLSLLIESLPAVADEMIRLGREIRDTDDEGVRQGLQRAQRQLLRWTLALKKPHAYLRILEDLDPAQVRRARRILPGLEALDQNPSLQGWLETLDAGLGEAVRHRLQNFRDNRAAKALLHPERLDLLEFLETASRTAAERPEIAVRFPGHEDDPAVSRLDERQTGLRRTVLTRMTTDTNETQPRRFLSAYRRLLKGDASVAEGPLASALAAVGGRWHQLFGVGAVRSNQQVWPVAAGTDRINIDHAILYEDGQPQAAVFPFWRHEVPLLFRLVIETGPKEKRRLHLALLDARGHEAPVRFAPRELTLAESPLATADFLEGDLLAMRVGLLESQGRRRFFLQGDRAQGFLLGLPRYSSKEVGAMACVLEDLVAMAPFATGPFRKFIERQFVSIFEEAARRVPEDPERQALIETTSRSPYPMTGRLLRFLRQDQRWAPEIQDLAAEIEFLRPMVARPYAIRGVDRPLRRLRRAFIEDLGRKPKDARFSQRRYHYVAHEERIEAALETVLDQIAGEGLETGEDRTIKIILHEGRIREPARTFAGPSTPEDPLREQAAYLEDRVNEVLASPDWDGIRDSLWRITFVVDRGADKRPHYVSIRNRNRYDQERKRHGYSIDLPGDRPFAVDPVVLGIDPAVRHRYGLHRLGAYARVEPVIPFDAGAGLVLLLHSRTGKDKFYYLASYLLEPETARIRSDGRMPGLLREHRRLSKELRRQLTDENRWPEGRGAPEWNRLSLYLEGVQYVSPAEWEALMESFAQESSYDRPGLEIEQVVVQARLEFRPDTGSEPLQVRAIAAIEDMDVGVPFVRVRYDVLAKTHRGENWVQVKREVLERMWRTKNTRLKRGEWRPANEPIRDKSPLDRRRSRARDGGGVFLYDQVKALLPKAVASVWGESGRYPERPERGWIREIYVDADGRFRVRPRTSGQNGVGMAAFRVRLKLPNHPEGRDVVVVGNDATHPDARLGSLNIESAKLFWLAAEYARQERLPLVYLVESSGAQMALPHEIIPRQPGTPLRLHWDPDKEDIYLTRAQVEETVRALGASGWEDVFRGRWEERGGEEDRLYPRALLKGGVNQLSLRGSALTAGAMARAALAVPTAAAILGGKGKGRARATATGIGMYDYRLARGLRIQRGDPENTVREDQKDPAALAMLDGAVLLLTGADAVNNMFSVVLFRDNLELGGAARMHEEGMTTHVVRSELEGLIEAVRFLNQASGGPSETVPPVQALREWRELDDLTARRKVPDRDLDRDLGPEIARSVERVTRQREVRRLPPNRDLHYDVADELAALLDRGTFERIPGTDHYAVAGTGRLDGYGVAAVGAQMLAEFRLDGRGRLGMAENPIYGPDGIKHLVKLPDANPAMTLSPAGAGDLADFIEAVTARAPWMPIVGDLAASGYDPRFVAASGRSGARLLSAIVHHPAPVLLWAGPRKKVLGGMKVTVAKELGMTLRIRLEDGVPVDWGRLESFADPGHIRVYADPTSFEAVLDPKGWRGIGFYKATVHQVARFLSEERRVPIAEAKAIAEKMVDKVIACMSSLERAAADGSFTAVVGADRIRRVLAGDVERWYGSPAFQALYRRWST